MVHPSMMESGVMWLYILVGPCWCVYVALFGSIKMQRYECENCTDLFYYIPTNTQICTVNLM